MAESFPHGSFVKLALVPAVLLLLEDEGNPSRSLLSTPGHVRHETPPSSRYLNEHHLAEILEKPVKRSRVPSESFHDSVLDGPWW